MSDSRPRSVERFFSPPIACYHAWIWKSTVRMCACASFCVCFFLSDWKCINCNSICPVFLRTSMRWRFSLLIGLDWSAKLRVTFLRNIGARLVTASVERWFDDSRIFFKDSSTYQIHPICKIAIFQFPHSLVAKDIQDSLVSKRWKYSIYDKITCKSNFLGLQSKLAESGGLSVLEND